MKCADCGATRSIRLCQGDLHLCRSCESKRFPRLEKSGKGGDKGKMADNSDELQHTSIEDRLDSLCKTVDKLSSVQTTLCEVQKSVNSFFEEFKKEMNALRNENKSLREQLITTERKLNGAQNEIESLQQYTRRNNLIIQGIPEKEDEITDDIVVQVAEAVGVHVSEHDIDISHRLPRNREQATSNIIVRFTRRTVRNQLYKAKKNMHSKTTSDLGIAGLRDTNNKIYINEQLTEKGKKLFHEANIKRKAAKWKYLWTDNGKILARKESGSLAVKISSLQDVQRIS
ncbi:uncharacterized protein LOC144352006 [Saccoglossus kowalevskii]